MRHGNIGSASHPPASFDLFSTVKNDFFRTVVKQFGEYLATDPFHTLGIPTIPLEHDHGEFFVLDQVIDGLEIHQLDHLVADFFRKYKMGGVHGESEVKVTTLECRFFRIIVPDSKKF